MRLLLALLFAGAGVIASADTAPAEDGVLASYYLGGLSGNEYELDVTHVVPGVTAGALSRGNGLNYTVRAENTFCANGWTRSEEPAENDYFSFTIAPLEGYEIDLEALDFTEFVNRNGPANFVIRSSLDDFKSNCFGPVGISDIAPVNLREIPLSDAFLGLTKPVTFRLIAWGSKSSGSGVWGIGNPKVPTRLVVRGQARRP